MTLDEMKAEALKRVEASFPEGHDFKADKVYEHVMDGTLVTIKFLSSSNKDEWAHIHFGSDETRFYRWSSDVLNAVANHKERNAFFRLLYLTGIGGVIALILVVIFSILLCALAFTNSPATPSIIEVVKVSFSIILGFFFGSQTGHKKDSK